MQEKIELNKNILLNDVLNGFSYERFLEQISFNGDLEELKLRIKKFLISKNHTSSNDFEQELIKQINLKRLILLENYLIHDNLRDIEDIKHVLNKIESVKFKYCDFDLYNYDLFNFNSISLSFDNCYFNAIWNHLKVGKNINYINCCFEHYLADRDYSEALKFKNCSFNIFEANDSEFKNTEWIFEKKDIKYLSFSNCIIENKFILPQNISIDTISIKETVFESKVEMKYLNSINDFKLDECRFKNFVDYEKTKFNDIKFNNVVFENKVIFRDSIFNKIVDFRHVTFKDNAIFKDTKFKEGLGLRDSIFEVLPSFHGVKPDRELKVKDRETARIIKDSFEQQNNIIEANKFYLLEMKKRKEELKKNAKENIETYNEFLKGLFFIFMNTHLIILKVGPYLYFGYFFLV